MTIVRYFLIAVCFLTTLAAQTITAPPQPTVGPGSNAYLYGALQNGPYNAKNHTAIDSYTYYIFTPIGLPPTPTNPNPLPTPPAAPVILFIHGYDGDTLDPYFFWMTHMTQMGFSVVWILYDQVPVSRFDKAIMTDFSAALTTLSSGTLPYPTRTPAGKPLTFYAGHSSGAFLALKVAAEAQANNLPVPAGVFSLEPGQGQIPSFDPSTVNANTLVMIIVGDQDKSDRICEGVNTWSSLAQIPATQKPFLLVRSDAHGTPAQVANHWYPLTATTKDTAPPPVSVDDRDYNISYKLAVAMARCIASGTFCDYVYGNGPVNSYGATTQTDMGVWSDGAPVLPMVLVPNPVAYFGNCQ